MLLMNELRTTLQASALLEQKGSYLLTQCVHPCRLPA